MPGNRGKTSLRCKGRRESSMRDFDRLPKELRVWIADADLPWRPKSVRRSFDRALSQTGDLERALDVLDQLQQRLVAKDSEKVWGRDHPEASKGFKA